MQGDVALRIEFFARAFTGHVADQSEDGSVKPRAVMLADHGPGDAGVAVGVAPVQLVAVVERDGPLVAEGDRGRPLQNLLGPVHAHVVVHPPGLDHLALGCVPQLVVGLGALQLLERIEPRTRVPGVGQQRLLRPRLGTLPAIVVGIVAHEEYGKLAPAD